jgi:hypothetical protein
MRKMDDAPDPASPSLQRYLELDARLEAARERPPEDAAEEAALLEQMESMWSNELSREERDWLEYRSLRVSAAKRGGDNVERKLARMWPDADLRRRAQQELTQYGREPREREVERVQLAVLKLSHGRIDRVSELVATAKQDPRGLLRLAEHPRQRGRAAGDEAEEEQRTEDMREYWDWLRE